MTKSLNSFFSFNIYSGDADAIEQMAYDFCKKCYDNNTIYAETRFAPHFLANEEIDLTPRKLVGGTRLRF